MDIQHLRYFVEITKNKSFTRAAEALLLTQPMLTRAIKQLEDELEVKLIERTSKSFHLTDAGEHFFVLAQELLGRHNDLYRCMDDVKNARIGEIKLSTPGVLLDVYFPSLLMEFNNRFPGIKLSIIEEGSKLSVQSVMSDSVDLGMVMLPVNHMSQLIIHTVIRDTCHVLLNRAHPLSHRKVIYVPELQYERIITFSETATLHDAFIELCEKHGFIPNITYKSLMPTFTMEMVSLGQCVGILPHPIIKRYITDNLVSIPLDPGVQWDIAIISKKDRYHSFAANKFLEFMREYFQTLSAPAKPQ